LKGASIRKPEQVPHPEASTRRLHKAKKIKKNIKK
jgi:hypothetical protein